MITEQQAKTILLDTVQNTRRHAHYKRTVEVAKYARQIHLGDTQQDLIVQYRTGETEAQKKQRVRLYNSLTPFVVSEIRKQLIKYQRTEHIRKEVSHTNTSNLDRIFQLSDRFFADETLEEHLFDRVLDLHLLDPNAFLICERKDEVSERGEVRTERVYPFEITSEQAVNYCFEFGELKWLIAAIPLKIEVERSDKITYQEATAPSKKNQETKEEKLLHDYYMYSAGLVLKLTEYVDGKSIPQDNELEVLKILQDKKEHVYTYQYFTNGTTEIPAVQMGVIKDPATYGQTYITPIHQVKELFDDLIQLKSQEDVTRAIHVFAKLFQYAPECRFETPEGKVCSGGYLDSDVNQKCPKCKGTGVKAHKSEQEAILLALPEDFENFFPLDKLAHYLTPPQHVPDYLDKKIDKLIGRISVGLFGSDVFERPKVVNTATEVIQEAEEINDVLAQIGKTYSRAFKKCMRVISQYLEVSEGFSVVHQFPNDFKTRSLSMLLNAYQVAKSSNSPYEILAGLGMDIMGKIYTNDPVKVKETQAWEEYKPFKSLMPEMVAMVLTERDPLDFDRVLYENFDRVKRLVKGYGRGLLPFFAVSEQKQKQWIEQAVEEVRQSIQYRSAAVSPFIVEPEPVIIEDE